MRPYHDSISEGMNVWSLEGDKLGKVIQRGTDGFIIEKGIFFPKDYLCRYEDVAEIRGDDVYLARRKEDLQRVEEGDLVQNIRERERHSKDVPRAEDELRSRDELRIPVVEEELSAEKTLHQRGEVKVHKSVRTEDRTISVPVTREEVHVERVAVSGDSSRTRLSPTEETFNIPVQEEVVEVKKHPVVHEEIRISKEAHREVQQRTVPVRKEIVEIEDESAGTRPRREVDTRAGMRADPDRDDELK